MKPLGGAPGDTGRLTVMGGAGSGGTSGHRDRPATLRRRDILDDCLALCQRLPDRLFATVLDSLLLTPPDLCWEPRSACRRGLVGKPQGAGTGNTRVE